MPSKSKRLHRMILSPPSAQSLSTFSFPQALGRSCPSSSTPSAIFLLPFSGSSPLLLSSSAAFYLFIQMLISLHSLNISSHNCYSLKLPFYLPPFIHHKNFENIGYLFYYHFLPTPSTLWWLWHGVHSLHYSMQTPSPPQKSPMDINHWPTNSSSQSLCSVK